MPLPTPARDETEAQFIERCMSDDTMQREYEDHRQRLAVCFSRWREHNKMGTTGDSANDRLIAAVRQRGRKRTEFGYGILTADVYVRTLREAVGLDTCYRHFATGGRSFHDVLEKAARTLVYSNPDMELLEKGPPDGDRVELPKNTLIVFRHVLTTARRDRDGDIMRTDGAVVDPKMLLLWQHVHTAPIGKLIKVAEHTDDRLTVVSAIVDMNELCHDAAVMVDNGMARFSHGFRAIEYEPIMAKGEGGDEERTGFDVKRFEIMEESLVSTPANVDAETEEVILSLVEGGKLTSQLMKRYGERIREGRPIRVPVTIDLKFAVEGKGEDNDGSAKAEGASIEAHDARGDEGQGPEGDEEIEGGFATAADVACAKSDEPYDDVIDDSIDAGEIATTNFVGSPRNKYGTHASRGFKGGLQAYKRAWRLHFSQVNGGALTPAASGPIRGTVRRTEMIAAAMSPPCRLPAADDIGPRTGPRSPLPGKYPEKPSDYGLTRWADPAEDGLTRDDVKLTCGDLKIIKTAAVQEIKRRIQDREQEGKSSKRGRVLSKANEEKIREALESIEEAAKAENLSRATRALLREAAAALREVLATLGDEEEPKRMSLRDAMEIVLSRADARQRQLLRAAFEALDGAEASHRVAENFKAIIRSLDGGAERRREGGQTCN